MFKLASQIGRLFRAHCRRRQRERCNAEIHAGWCPFTAISRQPSAKVVFRRRESDPSPQKRSVFSSLLASWPRDRYVFALWPYEAPLIWLATRVFRPLRKRFTQLTLKLTLLKLCHQTTGADSFSGNVHHCAPTQRQHSGLRALQTYRPCRISQ